MREVSLTAPAAMCAGVPICVETRAAVVRETVEMALTASDGHDIHLCSADTVVSAARDRSLRKMLQQASLNLPDGMSLVLATRRAPGSAGERVAGTDFVRAVWAEGNPHKLRHFLLGSTPEVLEATRSRLLAEFPGAELVGCESPPFRPLDDDEFAAQMDRIRTSRAQIVWVGLGSPKQDRAVAQMAANHNGVFVAVGAAFDFLAGNKRRAPTWMQKSGLEWVFRLVSEPKRLWRRYLIGLPQFAWYVAGGPMDGKRRT